MNTVKSTSEILAFKTLNRRVDKVWINWAVEMLMAGYDSENLLYLAGENENTNQFELQEIADKALKELQLDFSDQEKAIKDYVCYLIDEAILGKRSYEAVLNRLKDICIELRYVPYLYDFYSLYYAQEDLRYDTNQWYWENANRENINQVIENYFMKRKKDCV